MAGDIPFELKIKKEYDIGKGDCFESELEKHCCCSRCGSQVEGESDNNKLFVGGLSWETSDHELRRYFSKFGEVETTEVKIDTNTGRSRGFAFVAFKSAESVNKVLLEETHMIDNKKVDPKRATPKCGKIFVGGLNSTLKDHDILQYFKQFGQVVEIETPYDPAKQRRMGFCFITFNYERTMANVLEVSDHFINGQKVDVKRYIRGIKGSVRGRGRGFGRGGMGRNYDDRVCSCGSTCIGSGIRGGTGEFSLGTSSLSRGRGGRGRSSFSRGKSADRRQRQQSREMKLHLKLSVELDSD